MLGSLDGSFEILPILILVRAWTLALLPCGSCRVRTVACTSTWTRGNETVGLVVSCLNHLETLIDLVHGRWGLIQYLESLLPTIPASLFLRCCSDNSSSIPTCDILAVGWLLLLSLGYILSESRSVIVRVVDSGWHLLLIMSRSVSKTWFLMGKDKRWILIPTYVTRVILLIWSFETQLYFLGVHGAFTPYTRVQPYHLLIILVLLLFLLLKRHLNIDYLLLLLLLYMLILLWILKLLFEFEGFGGRHLWTRLLLSLCEVLQ
jgi:hypothetical protein